MHTMHTMHTCIQANEDDDMSDREDDSDETHSCRHEENDTGRMGLLAEAAEAVGAEAAAAAYGARRRAPNVSLGKRRIDGGSSRQAFVAADRSGLRTASRQEADLKAAMAAAEARERKLEAEAQDLRRLAAAARAKVARLKMVHGEQRKRLSPESAPWQKDVWGAVDSDTVNEINALARAAGAGKEGALLNLLKKTAEVDPVRWQKAVDLFGDGGDDGNGTYRACPGFWNYIKGLNDPIRVHGEVVTRLRKMLARGAVMAE